MEQPNEKEQLEKSLAGWRKHLLDVEEGYEADLREFQAEYHRRIDKCLDNIDYYRDALRELGASL